MSDSTNSLRPLWALLAAFAAVWIGWAVLLVLNPATLGADAPGAIVLRNAVRLAVWGGAAVGFARLAKKRPALEYLRLRGAWRGAALAGLASLAWAGGALLFKGGIGGLSLNDWLTAILCAPPVEEMLFRGVVFQELAAHWTGRAGVWRAAAVSALLFAAIHAPYWYLSGSRSGLTLLADLASVAALGLLFALALRRTGSLWSAIFLHMANNFAASL
ncbi:MAG TPA: CPBP family intramembrane glutamic endopeptidase [Herpetosiphonaceae bacterium]